MDILIIGTGNVGQVLARIATQAGHRVQQVAGRDAAKLKKPAPADIYVLAVTDTAIPRVARKLRIPSGVIAHTAGSVSKEVLASCGARYGVLWPLQSIRANIDHVPEIPWIVDGNDGDTRGMLAAFASSLSGSIAFADDDQRRALHLAAVYTSNFMNHLMAQAEAYCAEHGLDAALLRPLLTETVNRTSMAPAASLQTGPAVRGDRATIRLHQAMLKEHPEMLAIYRLFTRYIAAKRP